MLNVNITGPVGGLVLVLVVSPPHSHRYDWFVSLLAGVDVSNLHNVNLGL